MTDQFESYTRWIAPRAECNREVVDGNGADPHIVGRSALDGDRAIGSLGPVQRAPAERRRTGIPMGRTDCKGTLPCLLLEPRHARGQGGLPTRIEGRWARRPWRSRRRADLPLTVRDLWRLRPCVALRRVHGLGLVGVANRKASPQTDADTRQQGGNHRQGGEPALALAHGALLIHGTIKM